MSITKLYSVCTVCKSGSGDCVYSAVIVTCNGHTCRVILLIFVVDG